MEGRLDRYHKLGLQQSFSRIYHYPSACKELALILKLSYSKFPKSLQSLVFQDVIAAFRLLPRMQTQTAIQAANTLLQAVESTLPKQKKAVAVTEFKHAMVAHKRHSKTRHDDEEDLVELPQDVLVHVFSFLDLQSLLSSSQVCRSWNIASSDGHLWQSLYTNTSQILSKTNNRVYSELTNAKWSQESSIDWRNIFKRAYDDFSWKKLLTSSRGFCKHCHKIIWVSDMGNESFGLNCKYHQINPMSTRQIVEYIDGEDSSSDTDSDSDCDSYDDFAPKLWAYPRRRSEFSH